MINHLIQFRQKLSWGIFFLALFFIVDRILFALIASWREDQGANLYIGFYYFEWPISVGLLSSIKIPNPNGMIHLGAALAWLPGLIAVSSALGIIQVVTLSIWLKTTELVDKKYLLFVILPVLSSFVIRVEGSELWNNVIFVAVNSLFLATTNYFYKTGSPYSVGTLILFVLVAPSFYLAGLANAFAYGVLTAIALWLSRAQIQKKSAQSITGSILFLLSGMILLWLFVWQPYFIATPLDQIRGMSNILLSEKLYLALEAIFYTPSWLFRFTNIRLPLLYDYGDSLGAPVFWLSNLLAVLLKIQLLIAVGGLLSWAFQKWVKRNAGHCPVSSANAFVFGLLFFVMVSSPLLGGPNLHRGERIDIVHQFYPAFLFLVFGIAFHGARLMHSRWHKIITFNACCFVICNLLAGYALVYTALTKQSERITHADVPVIDKVRAVEYIAKDWKSSGGGPIIAVDYDIEGIWAWVPELNKTHSVYYPNVYTIGRALDYEFERMHQLKNYREGDPIRSGTTARYVITYRHTCDRLDSTAIKKNYFGRICVIKQNIN